MKRPTRKIKGAGKVAFLANLAAIRKDLDAGWPMSAVHERLSDKLGGLSYPQFARYVASIIQGRAEPKPARPSPPPLEGLASDRRRDPPKAFDFDPAPQQDDRDRFIFGKKPKA